MTLIEQVVRLRRTLHGLLSRRMAEVSDLPLQQLLILRVVSNGTARTQAEVADRLLMDAAAICRSVQRLESWGLLTRSKGKDRRSMRLELTEAARPHVELLSRELSVLDAKLREHLTKEEAETLVRLLDKAQGCLDGE